MDVLSALLSASLFRGVIPLVADSLGVLAAAFLLSKRPWRRWLPIAGVVLVSGAVFGVVVGWLLGDVLNLFDVDLSVATRAWFAVAVAGVSLAIARMLRARPRIIACSVVAALLSVVVGALGINADLGEFPTVKAALGIGGFPELRMPVATTPVALTLWKAPAYLPAHGRIGTVSIPATASRFPARRALVYLPPAALVRNPPRLPVLELMSGQPGSPSDLFTSGRLGATLDAYAQDHGGLAPIVVVPDQLGAPNRNPMCVDSALGKSATYLTEDVPRWISAHLSVLRGPAEWGIGGFSQGGTCSIQLGAGHPDLFGTILDISGQRAPKRGTLQNTIDQGFAGSTKAYEDAVPGTVMKARAPYSTFAVFVYGQDDARYGPGLRSVAAEAREAGMSVRLYASAGTAHDWHTVQYAFTRAIPLIAARWGLDD